VHTFLNEAKLSSIALSIRMAILKDKFVKDSPKLLVLDDLLLSLDMGNREAVLNIILEEYLNDYQIIFLTHDRMFFQTILSYIKSYHSKESEDSKSTDFKDSWKVLEMYESSLPEKIKIPVITDYESNLQKAYKYFMNHEYIDYNACGNNLRAALEEFFIKFLPKEFLKNNKGNPIDNKSLMLNLLIDRCMKYFNHLDFDISVLEKLNRL